MLRRDPNETAIAPGVVSITTTRRRRFLWCAWLGGAPTRDPFRAPDAWTNGGSATPDEAHADAERACGVPLRIIEPTWARAWMRLQRGEPAFYERSTRKPAERRVDAHDEALAILGLATGATAEEIKRAFKRRALETHPDRGGDDATFRSVMAAWTRLRSKRRGAAP